MNFRHSILPTTPLYFLSKITVLFWTNFHTFSSDVQQSPSLPQTNDLPHTARESEWETLPPFLTIPLSLHQPLPPTLMPSYLYNEDVPNFSSAFSSGSISTAFSNYFAPPVIPSFLRCLLSPLTLLPSS